MRNIKDNIGRKQISINLISNVISYSANILVAFVLTPFLIRTLGKEIYSFFPIVNSIVTYMLVLTNAMNAMTSRFVTVCIVQEDVKEANIYYSSALFADLIISCILCIPMILIVKFIDRFMDIPVTAVQDIRILFGLVFGAALINIISSFLGISTFVKNRIDLRSLRELIIAVVKIFLFFVLYGFLCPSIIYVGIVTICVAILNAFIQIIYTKKLLPEVKIAIRFVSKQHTKELLKSSIWSAINSFGNSMLCGMSIFFANVFYGASASGIYAVANTVPQFINGVICMLVGVFFPVITYNYANNNRDELVKNIYTAQKMVGLIGCAVISVFGALSYEFFCLWTPEENPKILTALSWIMITPHFLISCIWPITNLNIVLNKVKIPALFTITIGTLNIVLAYASSLLWKSQFLLLAIISTLLQIIWIGIFVPLYACKVLKIKWYTFYTVVIKAILCSALVIPLIYVIKSYFEFDNWIQLLVVGSGSGALAIVLFGLMMGFEKNIKRKK